MRTACVRPFTRTMSTSRSTNAPSTSCAVFSPMQDLGPVDSLSPSRREAEVHVVAQDAVGEAVAGAEVPHQHEPRVDSRPCAESWPADPRPLLAEGMARLPHGQSGRTRALRVIALLDGSAEDRHQLVADVFLQRPPIGEDLLGHPVVVLAENLDHLVRAIALRVAW